MAARFNADSIDRQLWEIDVNLIRTELPAAEQAEHLVMNKELWDRRGGGRTLPTGGVKSLSPLYRHHQHDHAL